MIAFLSQSKTVTREDLFPKDLFDNYITSTFLVFCQVLIFKPL